MTFKKAATLHVFRRLSDGSRIPVGELAQNSSGVYFRYARDYLEERHSLAPFTMPFDASLQEAPARPHRGLHGLFSDSLPDSWGRLLMDRMFQQNGIAIDQLTEMDRLAYIGECGMGALSYEPVSEASPGIPAQASGIDELSRQAVGLFDGTTASISDGLATSTSPGGMRPKLLVHMDPNDPSKISSIPQENMERRLLKLTSGRLELGHEEGLCEAAYLTLARMAGISVPAWALVEPPPRSQAIAWLAIKRFDCVDGPADGRRHMLSLSGLLDADFRTPALDCSDIIKAGQMLCQTPQVGRELFRRAIFNLLSANQDDHAKNFAFLMDDDGQWQLAPAYDLTFSPHPYNEHATAFGGHGKAPPLEAVKALARHAGCDRWRDAQTIIQDIADAVGAWPEVASDLGIRKETRRRVSQYLEQIRQQNRALLSMQKWQAL